MIKKLNSKGIKELIKIFKKIHADNSREEREPFQGDNYLYTLMPTNPDNFNEICDKIFMSEIKPILLAIRGEDEEWLSNESTFLFFRDKLGKATPLKLKEYLDNVVEKSNNYFDYLLILFEKGYTHFNSAGLNWFTSKHIFNDYVNLEVIIDIKEIRVKKPYITVKEKKIFDKIEYCWRIKDYEEIYSKNYTILVELMQWYLGREIKNKSKNIRESLKWILSDHDISKLEPFLKGIVDKFDGIIKDFFIMRCMLGKQQGITEENKEWMGSFENSLKINQKVCSRITIDLLKTIHNAIVVSKNKKKCC